MARRLITPEEKSLKELKKYTNAHGGPEVRIDKSGKYYCLQCGSYICDEGTSKLCCPGCGTQFDWRKYIVMTPVL